jgi:hypothetical protein
MVNIAMLAADEIVQVVLPKMLGLAIYTTSSGNAGAGEWNLPVNEPYQ